MLADQKTEDHLAKTSVISKGGVRKNFNLVAARRTEQTRTRSIRIVSSSTIGFNRNSTTVPFENSAACRVQLSIKMSGFG